MIIGTVIMGYHAVKTILTAIIIIIAIIKIMIKNQL